MPFNSYQKTGLAPGYPGMPYGSGRFADASGIVAGGQLAQVSTLDVTAANSTEYTLEIEGVAFSYTSDATATAPEIAQGLAFAIGSDAVISGLLSAAEVGGDLVLTGRRANTSFEVTETDSNLSLSTVDAAGAEPVPFGVLVMLDENGEGERICRPLVAQDGSTNLKTQLRYGIALHEHTYDDPNLNAIAGYPANANATVRTKGMAYVVTTALLAPGDDVYVRQSAGAPNGSFSKTSSGSFKVTNAKVVRGVSSTLAILELV